MNSSTEIPAASPPAIVFEAGARRGALPVECVVRILTVEAIQKLPFAAAPVEGLVFAGGVPFLAVDLCRTWGRGQADGARFLHVRTDKGGVLLRIDRVISDDGTGAVRAAGVLPEIDGMLAGYAAAGPVPDMGEAEPGGSGDDGLDLLMAEAAGRRVAIPASAVQRVGPVESASPLRGAGPGERLLTVAGEMIAGFSVGGWLAAGAAADEPWGVVIADGARRFALTVSGLRGLARAPRGAVRVVEHSRGRLTCWREPGHGAVEILDPPTVAGVGGGAADAGNEAQPVPAAGGRAERRRGLQIGNGIAARAGAYSCVFPFGSIRLVLRAADLEWQPRRAPGLLPVIDLPALLGMPPAGAGPGGDRHALLLGRPGRRPVIVLADGVEPLPLGFQWRAPPAVPSAFLDLFEAVGHDERAGCRFLVRGDTGGRAGLRHLARAAGAFAGWACAPAGFAEDAFNPGRKSC